MPDHVGIGVIQHDQVVSVGADRLHRLIRQFRRRHLGLEVVGRNLRRGNHDAVLAAIRLLLAAVEEIGDVRVLLRLRHSQLDTTRVGDDLAEHIR
jgi:hypothetical protein